MSTLVFVVTHNPDLVNDEYKVSLWYILQSVVFYFLASFAYSALYRRKGVWRLWKALLPWKVSGYIGTFWAINYVGILVAGPYLPSSIQTIFAQCQTIIVYVVNFSVFHNKLRSYHHAIIGAIIGFNLSTAWSGGFETSQTAAFSFMWCVIFMCNALAAGFSNNLLEAFFVVSRADGDDEGEMKGGYDIRDYVLAINAIAGIWSLVASVGLIFIAALAYKADFVEMVFKDWTSFQSLDAQLYILGMGISSWLYTILAYFIIAKTTALWMTVASTVGIICQLVFLSSSTAGIYQSVPNTSGWINNAILCVLAVVYAYGQPNKDDPENLRRISDSFIGEYYKEGIRDSFDGDG